MGYISNGNCCINCSFFFVEGNEISYSYWMKVVFLQVYSVYVYFIYIYILFFFGYVLQSKFIDGLFGMQEEMCVYMD